MDARTRYALLMEGKPVPQTVTPINTDSTNFGVIQMDSPQALAPNPRQTAPAAYNGAYLQGQEQQMMTIQVPLAVGQAWMQLMKQHNLDHDLELTEALTDHLTWLRNNDWQASEAA